jgi:hypothetical protein
MTRDQITAITDSLQRTANAHLADVELASNSDSSRQSYLLYQIFVGLHGAFRAALAVTPEDSRADVIKVGYTLVPRGTWPGSGYKPWEVTGIDGEFVLVKDPHLPPGAEPQRRKASDFYLEHEFNALENEQG